MKTDDRIALEAAYVVIAKLLYEHEGIEIDAACVQAEHLIIEQAATTSAQQAEVRGVSAVSEPALYVFFSSSGKEIRLWTRDGVQAAQFAEDAGVVATLFYADPAVIQGLFASDEISSMVEEVGGLQVAENVFQLTRDDLARYVQAAVHGKTASAWAPSEKWLIARQTVIDGIPDCRPELGYTVFAEATTTFDSFEEASDAIRELKLPLGWVAMKTTQGPWSELFAAPTAADGETATLQAYELTESDIAARGVYGETATTQAPSEPYDDNPDGIIPGQDRGPRMNSDTGFYEGGETDDDGTEEYEGRAGSNPVSADERETAGLAPHPVQSTADGERAPWLPTAENVNALPAALRDYIHALEANCDPSGTVRENTQLRDTNHGLQKMYRRVADSCAVAEVVEELEHDGTGFCAKVRWLFNPVGEGEYLYWPSPTPPQASPTDGGEA